MELTLQYRHFASSQVERVERMEPGTRANPVAPGGGVGLRSACDATFGHHRHHRGQSHVGVLEQPINVEALQNAVAEFP